jgi:hypothetical protein
MVIPMITSPRFHISSSGGERGEGVLVVPSRCMALRNRPELWRNFMNSNIFLHCHPVPGMPPPLTTRSRLSSTCLPFFFLFFSGGGEILYVQPPGHQAVLGRVGLLSMMVGASLPTKTPPRIHTQAPGTTCALLQVPGFGFCLRVVPQTPTHVLVPPC